MPGSAAPGKRHLSFLAPPLGRVNLLRELSPVLSVPGFRQDPQHEDKFQQTRPQSPPHGQVFTGDKGGCRKLSLHARDGSPQALTTLRFPPRLVPPPPPGGCVAFALCPSGRSQSDHHLGQTQSVISGEWSTRQVLSTLKPKP